MKIIHINRNIIQKNAKHSNSEPVVRVEENGKVQYCMEVDIKGPGYTLFVPLMTAEQRDAKKFFMFPSDYR